MTNCLCTLAGVILVILHLVAAKTWEIKTKNNHLVSAYTLRHSSTYINLYVSWSAIYFTNNDLTHIHLYRITLPLKSSRYLENNRSYRSRASLPLQKQLGSGWLILRCYIRCRQGFNWPFWTIACIANYWNYWKVVLSSIFFPKVC